MDEYPTLRAFLRNEREFFFEYDEDGAIQKRDKEGAFVTSRTIPQWQKDNARASNINRMRNWMVETTGVHIAKKPITKTAEGTRQELTYTCPTQPIRKTGLTDKERENAEKAEKQREYQREYRRKRKEEKDQEIEKSVRKSNETGPAARNPPKKKK